MDGAKKRYRIDSIETVASAPVETPAPPQATPLAPSPRRDAAEVIDAPPSESPGIADPPAE